MVKVPIFSGSPKKPLFIVRGGNTVPAFADGGCGCCFGCGDCDPTVLTIHAVFPSDCFDAADDNTYAFLASCPSTVSGQDCFVVYTGFVDGTATRICVSHDDLTGTTRVSADLNGSFGYLWWDDFADSDGAIYCAGGAGTSLPDQSGHGCSNVVLS